MKITPPLCRITLCWAGRSVLVGLLLFVSLASASPGAPAQDDIEAALARVPAVWARSQHYLTLKEYEATLQYWVKHYPEWVTLQKRAESHDGLPVYLIKITESGVSDDDKQVCLVTSLHGGPERSGSTSTLHVIEWLLGDSAEADETRRKQVVLFMPIPNPHSYFVTDRFGNARKIDLYNPGLLQWNFETLTLTSPKDNPELAAFLEVVDEYQPEVHTELHGVGLQEYAQEQLGDRKMYVGQRMFEVSGLAYSNTALRPWDPRVTEAMIKAGQEAGYGSDRAEADSQRLPWGPTYAALSDRFWNGRPMFYSAHYGYAKYHTMVMTQEVGWEESGLARTRALFALGNRTWVDECTPGYPVDRVKSLVGTFVTAYGQTAVARRRSRVNLWQAQGGFGQGVLYPQTAGRDLYICAVTPTGIEALNTDTGQFVSNLRRFPSVRADVVEKFIKAGPEIKLAHVAPRVGSSPAMIPVAHGIGFRLRIAYRNPELLDVRVNGHLLTASAMDGYQYWFADGFTQLQINIPPEKAQGQDLFIVTCAYKPDVERSYGWRPPAAVLQQLSGETKP
ncbi:MAG TPA: M14 family zinc carboxypeptidase [Opitutaceae bacterium]|nr:M14 family zinc carboxypeptidase [Opitutaceae bacterium]